MRMAPPGRKSNSQTGLENPRGPHHCATCFGSVQALNTSSRGASNTRVSTNSCSLFAMMFPVTLLFPLFLNVSQIVIQPVKAFRPEPPVVRGPVGNVLERTCLEPAGPPLRLVSPRDHSRAFQHLEVLGDGRHADLENLGQLLVRGFSRLS